MNQRIANACPPARGLGLFQRKAGRLALAAHLVLCAAALASPTVAHAQAPTAGEKDTARALHRSALKKFKSGDHSAALADAKASDLIMGVPTTRLLVAKVQEAHGKLLEARDTFLSIGRMARGDDEPAPFIKARRTAKERAAALRERIPSLTLVIEGIADTSQVSVALDGRNIADALLSVPHKVNPGTHKVVANAVGYKPVVVETAASEGANTRVLLKLQRADGATGPITAPDGPDGPGPNPPPPDASQTGGGSTPVLMYVGFGVGAAGLLTGIITGALAASNSGDLEALCPNNRCPPGEAQDTRSSAETLAHVSTVGFVVGGVGAAVGVVSWLLLTPDASDAASASVRLQLGPTSLGFAGMF